MNDAIKVAEDFFKSLGSLSPDLFAGIGVLAIIYIIKILPFISTKYYAPISILASPLVYVAIYSGNHTETGIGSPGAMPLGIERPWTRQILLGLIIGVVAWNIYEKGLSRIESVIAKRWPWLGQFLDTPAPKASIAMSPKEETAFIKEIETTLENKQERERNGKP